MPNDTETNKGPVDYRTITLDEARARLSNAVYAAARLMEGLSDAGRIHGSGHHAGQALAAFAVRDLEERWKGDNHHAD